MKVKIKKEGKTKEFKLINSWKDVTLESWAKLIDFENKSKSKEALETIKILSDIPEKLIKELSLQDIAAILSRIAELQAKESYVLKHTIKVEDKEYGFHPNLEKITFGEWADLETFLEEGVEKNLADILAVLYRPIVEKGKNDTYTIEAYDGEISIRAEELKKMKAADVQACLVFFWTFVTTSSIDIPLFLMQRNQKIAQDLEQKISQVAGATLE